jgi:hypothetical protein
MAVKPIYELFPERTRRVRRGRGFMADVKVSSIPSTRDFFEALAVKLVYYEETIVEKDMKFCGERTTYVDAFYDDYEHNRYGYIHHGICNCVNCGGLGLDLCKTGRDLAARVSGVQRYIHWSQGQELFLAGLCRYTSDMRIITPIVTYFYPYEDDRKSALLLQVRLIEQHKEIMRERALARARRTPPPLTFYDPPLTFHDDFVNHTVPDPGAITEVRIGQTLEPVAVTTPPPIAPNTVNTVTFAERLREILVNQDLENVNNVNDAITRVARRLQEIEDANVIDALDRAARETLEMDDLAQIRRGNQ